MRSVRVFVCATTALLLVATVAVAQKSELQDSVVNEAAAKRDDWVSLFNGQDLTGWTPKIRYEPLGEDSDKTFRVEDGAIRVSYEHYDEFDNRFGHLFYEHEYSNYDFRLEYRFLGDQAVGGAGWAYRNSGVMVHGQSAASMQIDQEFPVSIEVQLLGGDGENARPTGNLCTPGTHVVMDGKLFTPHCVNSNSATYHGDQWVSLEIQVRGHGLIRHWIDGKLVLEYSQAQLDSKDPYAMPLIESGQVALNAGTISLQSESHPVEFRNIMIRVH